MNQLLKQLMIGALQSIMMMIPGAFKVVIIALAYYFMNVEVSIFIALFFLFNQLYSIQSSIYDLEKESKEELKDIWRNTSTIRKRI